VTIHLHCTQVPPPPQAEGKKILLFPSVDKRVLPEETSTSLSPLRKSVTGPEGCNLALTTNSIPTKTIIMAKKTIILKII
jgi:hypothetical protein